MCLKPRRWSRQRGGGGVKGLHRFCSSVIGQSLLRKDQRHILEEGAGGAPEAF